MVHDLNSTEFGLLLTLELANAPSSPAEQSAEQSKFTLVSPDQLAELLETSIEITLRLEEDEQILCFRFDEAKESTALGVSLFFHGFFVFVKPLDNLLTVKALKCDRRDNP